MRILTNKQLEEYVAKKVQEAREWDMDRREAVENQKEHDQIKERLVMLGTEIQNLRTQLENLRSQFFGHVSDTQTDHEVCVAIRRTGAICVNGGENID